MSLVIVIPTYNEAENLPRLVSALFALALPLRVLVVDDNSPDGTGEIADALKAEHPGRLDVLHRARKGGLGPAYLAGFRHALAWGAEAVGEMDADFSHPPERLPVMWRTLQEGYDVVIGSRYAPGGSVDKRWPFWRKALSAFGNFYARTILHLSIRDATGGYRLYRRQALERIPLERVRSTGYVFQVELAYLAHLLGLRVAEVPIYFADRRWGESKMTLRIQLEAALRVWQLRQVYRDLRRPTP